MRKFILKPVILLLVGSLLCFSSCSNDDDSTSNPSRQFGIFKAINDTTAEMDGVIGSNSLANFNAMIAVNPNINTINIINCDGSEDDETNLQLSILVHQRGTNIHIHDNGTIASGGTDFFLAGTSRTKGTNTRVGVHSWSDGTNEATDFPVGHQEHQRYIDYYVSVGFTQQLAEAFYYYTINAASAANIHWMTDEEITQYNILTQ